MQIAVFFSSFFLKIKRRRSIQAKTPLLHAVTQTTVICGVMDLKVHFKVTVRALTLSFTEKNC